MPRKFEGGDITALRALIDSRGWQIVMARLVKTLDGKRDELERPLGEGATERLRGEIQAYRVLIGLPESLEKQAVEEQRAIERAATQRGRR